MCSDVRATGCLSEPLYCHCYQDGTSAVSVGVYRAASARKPACVFLMYCGGDMQASFPLQELLFIHLFASFGRTCEGQGYMLKTADWWKTG